MGVMFKSLTFDGTNSKDYGVYITGEAVFNAPERNVEMIDIPGRNGTYALDHGNFNNIEVSYPAGIFADNEADFAQAISDFRNFLCSKKGYCRLEDDYNTGEYREAVYKSGLEVTPALLKAGEFVITFDCKPQRFLTSGETAVSVTSGDSITNPTLFDSKPMLQIWGYGDFTVNNTGLEIVSDAIGEITAANAQIVDFIRPDEGGFMITLDKTAFANPGDTIDVTNFVFRFIRPNINNAPSITATVISGTATASFDYVQTGSKYRGTGYLNKIAFAFSYGTASSNTIAANWSGTIDGNSVNADVSITASYDGDKSIVFSATQTEHNVNTLIYGTSRSVFTDETILDSTAPTIGQPLYFDLDIGEAYKIENGEYVSINSAVTIPAELPTLTPGTNTFTYDNTITQFKVVPRWYIV